MKKKQGLTSETHLPAEQASSQDNTRISCTHEHSKRKKNSESTPSKRTCPPDGFSVKKTFTKQFRILTRREYRRVFSLGEKINLRNSLLYKLETERGHARLGLVVSRKFGKAHERNLFKRRVRELFRQSSFRDLSIDLVVHPRSGAKTATLSQLLTEIENAITA